MNGSRKRVLLTNGSGMIGANLARTLLDDNCELYCLCRPSSNRLRLQDIESKIHFLMADFLDPLSIRFAIQSAQPHLVYHLASSVWTEIPENRSDLHFQINTLGTYHLLDALRDFPKTRCVFTGSCAAYGEGAHLREDQLPAPHTLYGASKACASVLIKTFAHRYRLPVVELRLFTPYGPWEHPARIIPHTILSALDGRDVEMTSGRQQRDFVFIEDVIEALVVAGNLSLDPGSVFNVGAGVGISVLEVVQTTLKLMGNPVRAIPGALPSRQDEIQVVSADLSAVQNFLYWSPKTNLETGLLKTIAWFSQRRDFIQSLIEN